MAVDRLADGGCYDVRERVVSGYPVWLGFFVVSVVAFSSILFTGRYPATEPPDREPEDSA